MFSHIIDNAHIMWTKFPTVREGIERAKLDWSDLYKYEFSLAFGVVDCTHVRIQKPSNRGDEYCKHKGFYSINVLLQCE